MGEFNQPSSDMNYNAVVDKFNIKESSIDWKIGYVLIDFSKCCKKRPTETKIFF